MSAQHEKAEPAGGQAEQDGRAGCFRCPGKQRHPIDRALYINCLPTLVDIACEVIHPIVACRRQLVAGHSGICAKQHPGA